MEVDLPLVERRHARTLQIPAQWGDLNWRDVVRAEARDPEDFPTVVEVVEPGGHRTFRLLFDARTDAAEQDRALDAVVAAGGTYEGTGAEREGVYAVDVAPEASLDAVEAVLRRFARSGTLEYELGGSPEFLARLDEATITGNSTARHAEPEDGPSEPGRLPRVAEVVGRSGRLLIRVIVTDDGVVDPQAVAKELGARGASVERSAQWPLLLAIDVAGEEQAVELRTWLDAEEAAGRIGYETAWA